MTCAQGLPSLYYPVGCDPRWIWTNTSFLGMLAHDEVNTSFRSEGQGTP